jgi:hypothetical protein
MRRPESGSLLAPTSVLYCRLKEQAMSLLERVRTCGLMAFLLFTLLMAADMRFTSAFGQVGPQQAKTDRDGQHDFDFWFGRWKVHNRRLLHPLSNSNEWVEFNGKVVAKPVWAGRANMDEFEADSPSGHIEGMTVRTYDPKSHQWSLYWANAAKGVFEKPMVGQFKDQRGEFFDQEEFEGKAIYVRFVWSDIKANSCRWEQAFSSDGGKTWETNWIMTFTREKE